MIKLRYWPNNRSSKGLALHLEIHGPFDKTTWHLSPHRRVMPIKMDSRLRCACVNNNICYSMEQITADPPARNNMYNTYKCLEGRSIFIHFLATQSYIQPYQIQISRWRSAVITDNPRPVLLWRELKRGCTGCVTRWLYCIQRSRIFVSAISEQDTLQDHLSIRVSPCSWMFSRACTMPTTSTQPNRLRSWWFYTAQNLNKFKMSERPKHLVLGAERQRRLLLEPVHPPKRDYLIAFLIFTSNTHLHYISTYVPIYTTIISFSSHNTQLLLSQRTCLSN